MENNFNNIIQSIYSNSAVWISGSYGTGKTALLKNIESYFKKENFEVKPIYIEPMEKLNNFLIQIFEPIKLNINVESNYDLNLNQLMESLYDNHKKGLVLLIDEFENILALDHKIVNSILNLIQIITEFILNHSNIYLIIFSHELSEKLDKLTKLKERFVKINL